MLRNSGSCRPHLGLYPIELGFEFRVNHQKILALI